MTAIDAGRRRSIVGLISGTSADGIDAALVRFGTRVSDAALPARCTASPCRGTRRCATRLVALGQGGDARRLDELGTLDVQVGRGVRRAATAALLAEAASPRATWRAIGSHGQTLRHRPAGAAYDGCIRSPCSSATATSSPSAPASPRSPISAVATSPPAARARRWCRRFHAAMLHSADEDRAVLNLGGIANFTLLPRATGDVRGFDTGPANALMDAWCLRHRGEAFDRDGAFAAQRPRRRGTAGAAAGRAVVRAAAAQEQRARAVPSRLGRGDAARRRMPPADVQATLLELTAAHRRRRAAARSSRRRGACSPAVAACTTRALMAAHRGAAAGLRGGIHRAHRPGPGLRRGDGLRLAGAADPGRRLPGNLPAVTGATPGLARGCGVGRLSEVGRR